MRTLIGIAVIYTAGVWLSYAQHWTRGAPPCSWPKSGGRTITDCQCWHCKSL